MARDQGSNGKNEKLAAILTPKLFTKLEGMSKGETVRVIIKLQENVPNLRSAASPRETVQALKETAEKSQKPVIEHLSKQIRSHTLKHKDFWIVNVICAELTKAQIVDLAAFPGIARISEDCMITAHKAKKIVPHEHGWDNIGMVKAPEVWAMGYRGQNVKVAVLDTGVDINHPELIGALGGLPPYYEGYWVEFDEDGEEVEGSTPHDSDEHGTHVSGTVAGRNVNWQIGMAPEAVLGHGLILPEGGGSMEQVLAGLQWVIDNGYQVVNGSWGIEDIIPELAEAVENLMLAGVFPAFSIGNEGAGVSSSPGNTPLAEGVGAFGPDGEIADFSSGGYVEYPDFSYSSEASRIKPDISAPGVEIVSAIPGGRYDAFDGTSMASPHVAGAVALLLSKNNSLNVEELKNILHESVGGMVGMLNDPGEAGKDDRYGWGRLNVLQAIAKVPEIAPVGWIEGYVQGEKEFVANALLTFAGPETKTLATNSHGYYSGSLKEGSYKVSILAPRYWPQESEVEILQDEKLICNFYLEELIF